MGAVNEDDLGERLLPRSVRHKRVLDIAAEQPDASMEEIAEEVPSATADLVERVLDDYGDPAEDVVDDLDDGSDGPSDPIVELPDPSELTSTQRETIRQIREHPEETQADIAARLGVTAPTVCNRLNSIEGFDWSKRRAIAASILDPGDGDPEETLSMSSNDSQHQMETDTQDEVELERLAERIIDLERRIEDLSRSSRPALAMIDADLTHKVLHACLHSEQISAEEELKILESFVSTQPTQ